MNNKLHLKTIRKFVTKRLSRSGRLLLLFFAYVKEQKSHLIIFRNFVKQLITRKK